jgi:hypothetical protein
MAEKTNLRGTWIAEETSFGVEPSATGSGYVSLVAEVDIPKFTNDLVENNLQSDTMTKAPPDIGAQQASFGIKIPLRASGTPGTAVPAIAPETDLLLTHAFGSVVRGTGSTVTAGGTTNTANVTSSAGFRVGGLVYATQPTAAGFYAVKTIPNGTSVTLEPTPPVAITSGTLVGANYYLPVNTGHKSLAFVHKIGSVLVTFLGCKLSGVKITGAGPGGRAMLEATVEADSFSFAAKASLPAGTNRFPSVLSPIVKGAKCWSGTAAVLVADVAADFGVQTAWLDSTEGVNNRSGFEVVDRAPTGSILPYYASAYLTDLVAGTDKTLGFATGTQTNGWGFYVPRARWNAHELQEKEGTLRANVGWMAADNGTAAEFVLSVF